MSKDLYSNLKVGKPEHSEIEITGEIPAEILMEHFDAVLSDVQLDFESPGFRKGKVPLDIVKQNVHEHRILEDAAERALQETYPAIINEQKLDVLGRPEVTITKLAAGNPLEFKIRVGVRPEFKLPDYKKIADTVVKAEAPIEVSDAEITEVITTLQKMRMAQAASAEKKEDGAEKEGSPEDMPELTNEFVKTLGNFENVEDFKTKLRANISLEKKAETQRALRDKIAAALVLKTTIDLPQVFVAEEALAMFDQLKTDLEHAKLSFEDYLKRANKSEEEILKDQREYVERQIKTRLILEAIAKAENIEPKPEDVRVESDLLLEQHPDMDPVRIENYVSTMLRNEAVIKMLEEKKD